MTPWGASRSDGEKGAARNSAHEQIMKIPNKDWWDKALQARDRLFEQLRDHPAVSLVDIGVDLLGESRTPVLRVHLRGNDVSVVKLPSEIDGIPVRVLRGDYQINDENQS
jgi:hypothetical protein